MSHGRKYQSAKRGRVSPAVNIDVLSTAIYETLKEVRHMRQFPHVVAGILDQRETWIHDEIIRRILQECDVRR